MSQDGHSVDQDDVGIVLAPEDSRLVDIGNGQEVPEIIFTYERGVDGKIHRKKKRLVKRPRGKGLNDV